MTDFIADDFPEIARRLRVTESEKNPPPQPQPTSPAALDFEEDGGWEITG